ncbi:MAG: tripartite tricarboxylate transporter TctB family protein [Thermodesulfobacteriota bacterium]
MRKLDFDIIVLFLFSLIVCYESSRLALGNASKPGPGLFPLLLGVTLGVLSFIFLLAKGFKQDKKGTPLLSPGSGKRVIMILGTLCLYSIFFSFLGYLISTFLLTFYLLSLSYPARWIRNGIGSVFICGVFYMVFQVLFDIRFPTGILGF